ncbi:SHOCT domain-containing protein [Haloarchaeobius litoreus]|uniref:SHOCT domain-containing protein n=1 Tax=Haloarchaeobius litoreus TaxID=755306 RepID=A0ABD6DPG2_9EURY|nr:SHOCT domain-containing protein [Haloarchaeobius litoreus]
MNGTDGPRVEPSGTGPTPVLVGAILLSVLVVLATTLLPLFFVFGFGGGSLGTLLWYLPFLVPFLVVGVVGLTVWLSVRGSSAQAGDDEHAAADPLDVLEARYTDGEIDLEEYEHRLERLFELDGEFDAHPRVEQLAIRYARGGIDRDALAAGIERLDAAEPAVRPEELDQFLGSDTTAAGGPTVFDDDVASVTFTVDRVAGQNDDPTAIELLRQRYAEGAISDEEYERRLELLRETERGTER